jgi:Arc/MetJ-type ribon-helix-helix transcriptional regulator
VPAKFVRSVSLTPELTALIDAEVASGHDGSASEEVQAALCLLDKQDRWVERPCLPEQASVSDHHAQ